MKFPPCFKLQIVYIMFRSKFMIIPNCVRTLGLPCIVPGDGLQGVLRINRVVLRKFFLSWAQAVELGVSRGERSSPRKRSSMPRSFGAGESEWEGGWQTWSQEPRGGRPSWTTGWGSWQVSTGSCFVDAMSRHITEYQQVICCFTFLSWWQLEIISVGMPG